MGRKYRDVVRKHSRAKRSSRAVLNVLSDYADDDGEAWPGNERIANDTGLSVRTIQRAIDNLIELGELQKVGRGNGRGNVAIYRIVISAERVSSTTLKGDNVTPFGEQERVTSTTIKGDNYDTERVTSTTIKGDNGTSSLYIEPNRTVSKEPEVNRASARPPARTRAVVQVQSPHFTNQDFQNGYVPQGQGSNAVQVYYERFDIRHNGARLSAPLEDDLARQCTDLDRLRDVVTAYSRHQHYRPGNVSLIMDWYRNGIPQNGRKVQGSKPERVNFGAGASLNAMDRVLERMQANGFDHECEEVVRQLPADGGPRRDYCGLPGAAIQVRR